MSAPRTKRQFAGAASDPAQRQITSFFNKSTYNATSNAGESAPSNASSTSAPALPASVQSNLLSVGMRVRKSVPEGYKTGSAYGGFSLWSDADGKGASPTRSPATVAPATARELTPFCGIHKIGGFDVQPSSCYDGFSLPSAVFQTVAGDDSVPAADDIPGLTSSQESAASDDSMDSRLPFVPAAMASVRSATTNRKRFFNDDETSDVPGIHTEWRMRDETWSDSEVSPRSLAPASWNGARAMAHPRRRGRKEAISRGEAAVPPARLADLGQENAEMAVDGDDFGEASFLDLRWDERMDVE